jgi:hypothetical protein
MTIMMQILTGSVVLGICSLIHIVLLVYSIKLLHSFGKNFHNIRLWLFVFASAFATVLIGHTIQIWIWAFSFILLGALPNFAEAIYFAIVTYTTLGYGDIVLNQEFRIFAAMSSVTGLLNFGLSTAFLVGILARLFQENID